MFNAGCISDWAVGCSCMWNGIPCCRYFKHTATSAFQWDIVWFWYHHRSAVVCRRFAAVRVGWQFHGVQHVKSICAKTTFHLAFSLRFVNLRLMFLHAHTCSGQINKGAITASSQSVLTCGMDGLYSVNVTSPANITATLSTNSGELTQSMHASNCVFDARSV